MENENKFAQASEAELRRESIKNEYAITSEEADSFRAAMKEKLLSLENPTSTQVAETLDEIFSDRSERTSEIKKAYLDSLVRKIDESIRHFLTAEQQTILNPITEGLKIHLSGQKRLESVSEIQSELVKNEELLHQAGLSAETISEMFYQELRDYLSKL